MNIKHTRWMMGALGALLAVSPGLVAASASAATPEPDPSTDFSAAVEAADQRPASLNPTVDLPKDGGDTVTLPSREHEIALTVPADGSAVSQSDTGVVFDGAHSDSQVAVETTSFGVRALVKIESAAAPERFEFPFAGDVEHLELNDDGSVELLGAQDQHLGFIAPAWAVDADGIEVPTHYEVRGTILTQVVEHRSGDHAYGIVADPSVWQVLKCAAAITVAVASTVFAAAKILKIKKIIKAAGGVKNAAKRVIKSFKAKGSLSKKAKAGFGDLGSAVVAAAIVVLDIDTIKSNCS